MRISDILSESSTLSVPLYVGSDNLQEGIHTFKMRKAPRDTALFVHHYVNEKCKERFGLSLRSLFFCTPDPDHAATYGKLFEVYPQGNWRAFANPDVMDMSLDVGLMPYHLETKLFKVLSDNDKRTVERSKIVTLTPPYLRQLKTLDDFLRALTRDLDGKVKGDVGTIISAFKTNIERELDEYVGGIQEVTQGNVEEILEDAPEVMLYAPDGIDLEKTEL